MYAKILNVVVKRLYKNAELQKISAVFNALSNKSRLQIMLMLIETKRPLHIKAVAQNLQLDYGAVYRHVEVLKKANLLEVYEVGRSRVLSPFNIEFIKQLIEQVKNKVPE